jgi:hypothetical protein
MPTSRFLPILLLAALASGPPARAETRVRGVNVHSSVGSEVDAVPAMHLNFVRIDVVWSTIEAANGVLFWDELDSMVQTHRSRGLGIYATLGSTPKWVCRMGVPPVEGTCVPQEGYFGRFAKIAAPELSGSYGSSARATSDCSAQRAVSTSPRAPGAIRRRNPCG